MVSLDNSEIRAIWILRYFSEACCGKDHLSSDTRLGTSRAGLVLDNNYISDVYESREFVREIAIKGTYTYRVERFYIFPLVKVDVATLNFSKRDNAIINVNVWNSFRERMSSDDKILVYYGK